MTKEIRGDNMESLKELYKIGRGPSSSHTMGPERATKRFIKMFPDMDSCRVTLLGSLALTGKGHMTDRAVIAAALPKHAEIIFDTDSPTPVHPNTMIFEGIKDGAVLYSKTVYSIGGGTVIFDGETKNKSENIYSLSDFSDIRKYCKSNNLRVWEYVVENEGPEILDYLSLVWDKMKASISDGLSDTGTLDGGLNVRKKAYHLFSQKHMDESAQTRENRIVCSYAFAVSEQSAGGQVIVTAPTCGASGVVPAVMKYMQDYKGFSDDEILRALATGGLIGNIIKTNASISGAECGCQAEIGTACSMAAAALAELFGMGLHQIEYAAEVAMEHHLGLTCDPVGGLVQIPCIERNAVAAMRAINALSLANFLADLQKVSFDTVVSTMYETGKNMAKEYRETSQGGLATNYIKTE